MMSIRRKLTISLMVSIAAAFTTAGAVVHTSVKDALVEQFDEILVARSVALASLFEFESPTLEFNFEESMMPAFQGGPEPEYFALWRFDGVALMRSESLGESELPYRSGPPDAPEYWDLVLADGRAGRAIGTTFPIIDSDGQDGNTEDETEDDDDEVQVAQGSHTLVTVVVARSREGLDTQLAALTTGLLIAAGFALLLVWLCVTWAVRGGLTPLRELSAEVEQIDASSLSKRVGNNGVPAELKPVATRLNELLKRLESSFAKEKRMTAAMAHELRTPIAELRSASDVARRWPDDDEMVDEVLATAGDVAIRMSRSVDAVMRYCRLEAGQDLPELEMVRLEPLLDELWRPLERLAEERGIRFHNDVTAEAVVLSDRALLELILGNLLGNASQFATGARVTAISANDDASVILSITNETDQLTRDDLEHLMEPFWRKDGARTDGHHSGLGLTLVSSVARLLGITARFELHNSQFIASLQFTSAHEPPRRARSNGHQSHPAQGKITSP